MFLFYEDILFIISYDEMLLSIKVLMYSFIFFYFLSFCFVTSCLNASRNLDEGFVQRAVFNSKCCIHFIHSSFFSLSIGHNGYRWIIKYLYETALAFFCPSLMQSGLCDCPAVILQSSPLTPHFTSSVCLPIHILSNEAKSSMLNETSQLCHWWLSGHGCLLLALKVQTLEDDESVALGHVQYASKKQCRSEQVKNDQGRLLNTGAMHGPMCGLKRTYKVKESKCVC